MSIPALELASVSRIAAAAGAGVAAATDLTFSLYGYTAVVLNDFLTALYLILVKNSPASSGMTTTGLLFYNAALSLPLLGAAVALSGEPAGILAYPDKHSRGFQVRFGLLIVDHALCQVLRTSELWFRSQLLGAAIVL